MNYKKILLGIMFTAAVLFGCKEKIALFPPIVSGPEITSNTQPEFSWKASVGDATYYMVELINKENSQVVVKQTRVEAKDSNKWKVPQKLADGVYMLKITAYRPAEKKKDPDVASKTVTFLFTIDLRAAAGQPVITDVNGITVKRDDHGLQQGSIVIASTTPYFRWTEGVDAETYLVTLYNVTGDQSVPCFDSLSVSSNIRFYQVPEEGALSDGSYRFEVSGVTSMGLKGEPSVCEFEVNTQGGGAPNITEPVLPAEGAFSTNKNSLHFAWSPEILPSGDKKEFSWQRKKLEGEETTTEPNADGWGLVPGDRETQMTVNGLTDGRYVFFLRSKDQLGNWSAPASFYFIIDTVPPEIPAVSADKYTVATDSDRVTFSWDISEDTDYLLVSANYKEGENVPTPVRQEKDVPFVQNFDTATHDKTVYLFTFSAVDKAGNISDTITARVLYNPIGEALPTFLPWSGSINVSQPDGSVKYFSREVELQWSWEKAAGTLNENYKIAFSFSDTESAAAPPADSYFPVAASSWSESTQGESRGDGFYTLYVMQEYEAGKWTTPVSRTYIIARESVPEAPRNLTGATKVGAFPDEFGRKVGFPTWSWDAPAVTDGLAAFEYRYHKVGTSNEGTWIRTDSISVRSITEMSGLEIGDYIFYVRSVNILGGVSSEVSFNTSVVDAADLPAAPIITPEKPIVGGKDYTIVWNWTYPNGKAADKVWVKVGSEPSESDTPYTGGTAYSLAYDSSLEGKETNLTLFVKAHYTGDEVASLAGTSTVLVDLNPPAAPLLSGSAEAPETAPVWMMTHANLKDVSAFRYQTVVGDGMPADGNWTETAVAPSVNVTYSEPFNVGEKIVLWAQAADALNNWSPSASFATVIKAGIEPPQVTIPAYEAANYLNASMKEAEVQLDSATGDIEAIKYRFSNGVSAWSLIRFEVPAARQTFRFKPTDLSDGENVTFEYQGQIGGEWSKMGTYSLALIDVNAPSKPSNLRLQGGDIKTGDTTPRIEWNAVGDAACYEYIKDGVSSRVNIPYFISPELTDGKYTVSVVAVDRAENKSEPVSLSFEIDHTYRDYSRPEIISAVASKYAAKDYVRVSWKPESKSVKYAVYELTEAQVEQSSIPAPASYVVGFDTLTTENLEAGNAAAGYGKDSDGNYFVWIKTDNKTAYYGVIGMNDEGKTGFHRLSYTSAQKTEVYGTALLPVSGVSIATSGAKVEAVWKALSSDVEYRVLRSKTAYDYKTAPTNLPITDFNVWTGGTGWSAVASETDILNGKAVTASKFTDSSFNTDDYVGKEFVYRIYAVNTVVRSAESSYRAEFSGLQGLFFMSAAAESKLIILLPNPDNILTLAATQGAETNDSKLPGKIKLTVNEKGSKPDYSNFTVKVERTYRYGGTHQGYPTADLVSDNMWTGYGSYISGRYHTDLTNPDPAACPWEKTILLEYVFDLASNSSAAVYDTLYDTDDATGEKLIAVRRKISHDTMQPWYERKESVVSKNAAKYDIVLDPDGTKSEYEWHYLNWDWVMRKYMYHPDNPLAKVYTSTGNSSSTKNVGDRPGRFDIADAVRCDYRIVLVSKIDPSVTAKSEKTVSGYPRLTPREFSSLAMIIREIAFYEIPASYYDEVEEQGTSLKRDPVTVEGWNNSKKKDGSIQLVKVDVNIFSLSGTAHLRTNGSGYSYFPGCYIKFDWPGFTIKLGGDYSKCLDNNELEIVTPLPGMCGKVKMTAYLYGGTYYHGMQNGSFITVTYPGYTDFRMDLGKMPGAQNHKALVSNEYIESNWGRAQYTNNPDTYWDRYTSINWSYSNLRYPGFK